MSNFSKALVGGALAASMALSGVASAKDEPKKFEWKLLKFDLDYCLETFEDEEIELLPIKIKPNPEGQPPPPCNDEESIRTINQCVGNGGGLTKILNRTICRSQLAGAQIAPRAYERGCVRQGGSLAARGNRAVCRATPRELTALVQRGIPRDAAAQATSGASIRN